METPPCAEMFVQIEKLVSIALATSYYQQRIWLELSYLQLRITASKNEILNQPATRRTFIGRIGDRVIGYTDLDISKGNDIEIVIFAVAPQIWGTGYADIFLQQMVNQVQEHFPKVERIWGVIRRTNRKAINFYKKFAKIDETLIKKGYDPNMHVVMYWTPPK